MLDHQYNFRRLDKNSVQKVILLQRLSYSMDYQENPEVFCGIIDSFPEGAWGIYYEDELIGYIFFHPYYADMVKPTNNLLELKGDEDCMYLHDMNISPVYRGQGFPVFLVQKFNEITLSNELHSQYLIAVQNSSGFWERFGFKQIKSVQHSGYANGIIMKRIID